MSLRFSYTLLAPFYDWVARPAFGAARARSLARLPHERACRVLLSGAGTGLDLAHVPALHHYVALNVTRAMLRRAPESKLVDDAPVLAGGWFRAIRFVKT
jgi:hypothetical protein